MYSYIIKKMTVIFSAAVIAGSALFYPASSADDAASVSAYVRTVRADRKAGDAAESSAEGNENDNEASDASGSDNENESEDTSKKADKIKLVTKYITRNGKKKKQFAVIKAFNENGEKLWKYTTKKYSATGLDATTYHVKKDTVYIFEAGTLIELDKDTGEKKFRSKKKMINGYNIIFTLDDEDNIYAQGYYMNVIYKFDRQKRKTVWKKDIQKSGNYWPKSMKFKDDQKILRVVYKGGSVVRSGEHYIEFRTDSGKIKKSN